MSWLDILAFLLSQPVAWKNEPGTFWEIEVGIILTKVVF